MLKYWIRRGMIGAAGVGARTPRTAPILTYHSIDPSGSIISVDAEAFRAQMRWLAEHDYRVAPLADVIASLERGEPTPERTVVLTFDDGFRNNLEVAAPILAEHGFPATLFLATGFVDGDDGRARATPAIDQPILSWDQVREIESMGWDVQAHTIHHPHMTELGDDALRDELVVCREELEQRLGHGSDIFCYPFGDHDARVAEAVERHGYRAALTIVFGADNHGQDRFRLRRVGMQQIRNLDDFAWALDGVLERFIRVRDRIRGRGVGITPVCC